jgi:hypothetical protein
MGAKRFAPTVKEAKRRQEVRLEEINSKDSKEKKKAEKKNSKNADSIINDLRKMFEKGLVSDTTGCSIDDIYTRDCNDDVLKLINDYLDGNWTAEFKMNTGMECGDKSLSTLIVRPVK